MLDPKVFKAYDVRGIYGPELDEAGAYAVGRAFVEQFEPERLELAMKVADELQLRVYAENCASSVEPLRASVDESGDTACVTRSK